MVIWSLARSTRKNNPLQEMRRGKIHLVFVGLEDRGAILRPQIVLVSQEGDLPLKSTDPQFQPLKLISLVSKVRENSVLHRPASVSWSYFIPIVGTQILAKCSTPCTYLTQKAIKGFSPAIEANSELKVPCYSEPLNPLQLLDRNVDDTPIFTATPRDSAGTYAELYKPPSPEPLRARPKNHKIRGEHALPCSPV